jgi:hypothetical protein
MNAKQRSLLDAIDLTRLQSEQPLTVEDLLKEAPDGE